MDKIKEFVLNVAAWLIKNAALIVGIIEALVKLFAGIASLTPTKADDVLVPAVDKVASQIKKALYTLAEKLAGKIPN